MLCKNRKSWLLFWIRSNTSSYGGGADNKYIIKNNEVQMADGSNLVGSFGPATRVETGLYNFNFGATKRIIKKIWVAAGLGFDYFRVVERRPSYNIITNADKVWVRNADTSQFNNYFEISLVVRLWNFLTLTPIVTNIGEENLIFRLGLGLSI